MQIICPNCGSRSPIEAGSLVTQTRIVCARCAVEFSAELSDEPAAVAPPAPADERGIELYSAAELAPDSQTQPVQVTEVAAPADIRPAVEVAVAEPAHEAAPAAGVFPDVEAAATEVASATQVAPMPAAKDVYEVLTIPEELVLSGEGAGTAGAAGAEHSNVLEDVFAAWNQARESKPEADSASTESAAPADEYVTTPLSDDGTHPREVREHEAEPIKHPSSEVTVAPADSVEPVGEAVEEAARKADDEHDSMQPPFADVRPQVAAAQAFDGYGLGVRLMRVSPLWLLVSGLSFISFVVFCNWFFVPANVAQAESSRPTSLRNEAANRSLASAADMSAARPDARNSNAARASLPAEGEVGNASVKIEESNPAPTTPPATPAPTPQPTATPNAEQPKQAKTVPAEHAPAGRFTVQVGSYNVPAEAEARAASLKSAGQSARVVGVEIPKRGKWYRVYVGGFASRGEAESHGQTLRGRGLAESYIATEAQ